MAISIVLLLCLRIVSVHGGLPCDTIDEDVNVLRAYEFAKASQFEEAHICFRRAVHYFPYTARLFTDLGRVLLRIAKRGLKSGNASELACEQTPVKELIWKLREACSSIQLGRLLGDAHANARFDNCAKMMYSLPCHGSLQVVTDFNQSDSVKANATEKFGNTTAQNSVAVARSVCGETLNPFASISKFELDAGRLNMQTLLSVYVRLHACGLVELRGALIPEALLENISMSQRSFLESSAVSGDNKVAVERWERRYEMQVPLVHPFIDQRLVANPLLLEVVRLTLGPRVEIDTFSHVTALPDAPDQPWHKDVDTIFKEPVATSIGHHPPFGLVAVVPLLNLTESVGPTEFLVGSHIDADSDYWEEAQATENSTLEPRPLRSRPLPALGSIVLFDLRTRHRGTRNLDTIPRSILYLSFVKDWFLDRLNFRGFQSSAFDELDGVALKKLLRRVDTRTYVASLENFVAGRSADAPRPSKPFHEPTLTI